MTEECKSKNGLTNGLIDSIMTSASIIRARLEVTQNFGRAMIPPSVAEALLDLRSDPDLDWLLNIASTLKDSKHES